MDQRLLTKWQQEEQAAFSGWDFSHIKGRIEHGAIPWSYDELARDLLTTSQAVLDMGTGGGEHLAKLRPLPKNTIAVEGYRPNVSVAQKYLEPMGVKVIGVDDMQKLPLPDQSFDLILNYHTEYSLSDVARLLKQGGILLTQQVGGQNLHDITEFFGQIVPWPEHTLKRAQEEAEKAGLHIEITREWHGEMVVRDLGALVYFLKAVPWIVDGFTVEKYQDKLFTLQTKLEKDGELKFNEHRFLLKATKQF